MEPWIWRFRTLDLGVFLGYPEIRPNKTPKIRQDIRYVFLYLSLMGYLYLRMGCSYPPNVAKPCGYLPTNGTIRTIKGLVYHHL